MVVEFKWRPNQPFVNRYLHKFKYTLRCKVGFVQQKYSLLPLRKDISTNE